MQHRSCTCSADRPGRGRSVLRGTFRAVARRRAALSPSWDPGAGLCQVSRRDSRRTGACAARPVGGRRGCLLRAPSAASWALHWPRRTHPGTRERSRTLAPWTSGGPSSMSARWPAWAKRAPRCSPSLPARQRQTDPGWVARQRPTPVTRARMWHSTRPFPSKSSRRRCRLGAGWSKHSRSSWPTRCPRVCGACCCGATTSRDLATHPDSSRRVAAARPSSMAARAFSEPGSAWTPRVFQLPRQQGCKAKTQRKAWRQRGVLARRRSERGRTRQVQAAQPRWQSQRARVAETEAEREAVQQVHAGKEWARVDANSWCRESGDVKIEVGIFAFFLYLQLVLAQRHASAYLQLQQQHAHGLEKQFLALL